MDTDRRPPADVLDVLRHQHRSVCDALAGLLVLGDRPARRALIERIEVSLRTHLAYEEQVIHPLVASIDEELAHEAEIEHGEIQDLMIRVRKESVEGRELANVVMLASLVEAHVADEEHTVFPLLRRDGRVDAMSAPPPGPLDTWP